MKKIMITLFFVIVFSSFVVAQELDDVDFPPECAVIDCAEGFKCVKGGECVPIDRVDDPNDCVDNCNEVICAEEGEECRSKCIRGCKEAGDELRCLSCGDGCLPYDTAISAYCLPPTKEFKCGFENDKCIVLTEEDPFFEELESDLTEEELEELQNIDIGSGGITPDSPWYFLDEAWGNLFGEDRKEKIAEIKTMVEKGDYDAAKIALKNYKENVKDYVKDADPEKREAARKEALRIRYILKQIEQEIPEEHKEEFVDAVIENEKAVVTAVEISSKIKELCESLAELDPTEYSSVCKTDDDSPNWQKKLDKELTNEQRDEAAKFGNIMAECFESSGENCKCNEIPFPQFAEACSRAAPLALACEKSNDEEACKKLDNFQMPRLPPHLEQVMMRLDGKVMESKFDLHMPPECEGISSPNECRKIMIEANAPEECKEALLAADLDNEREARKICDKIMMEQHSPECAEQGITDPEECARVMDSRRDESRGPIIDFDCKKIEDSTERLGCYDKSASQAKGYTGMDEDYEGPCMTESDWAAKKQECRELYGENAGDEPIKGDSGQGYECVIDAKCIDFGEFKGEAKCDDCASKCPGATRTDCVNDECKCYYEEAKGCYDCETKCPGATRTDCVNDECKCYYDESGPGCDDCASECEDIPGQLLDRTDCVNGACECYYKTESECKDGCQQECGDQNSDCVNDKCVCLGYTEGDAGDVYDPSSDSGSDSTTPDDSGTPDAGNGGASDGTDDGSSDTGDSGDSGSTDDGSSDSGSDDGSASDDSGSTDSGDDSGDSGGVGGITGNLFLDYWYN